MIDRYILREALPIFLFGLVLYAVLGVLTQVLAVVQWITTAPLIKIIQWVGLQMPQAIVQAMPIAGLLAIMLAFGRLSRENELMVMQAGGISVLRTARVFLLGGLLLSISSLLLSEYVVPKANRASVLMYWNELVPERTAQFRLAGRELPIGDFILRFEQFDPTSNTLKTVRLERWQGQTQTVILAQSAEFRSDRIALKDYKLFTLDFARLPIPDSVQTLEETQNYLRSVFRSQQIGPAGAELTIRLSSQSQDVQGDLEAGFAGGGFGSNIQLSEWWRRLQNPQATPFERREARAQWHSGVAISFANLLVLILALPIAVRRATSPGTALGIALVLTIVYYIAFTAGRAAGITGGLPPELAAWGTNLVGVVAGWWIGKGVYR